jgi:hypothetical protein
MEAIGTVEAHLKTWKRYDKIAEKYVSNEKENLGNNADQTSYLIYPSIFKQFPTFS